MSEEKKDEILGKEKELDESEMEAVTGAKGSSCECMFAGFGAGKEKAPCFAFGEGKHPCACFETGNGDAPKP